MSFSLPVHAKTQVTGTHNTPVQSGAPRVQATLPSAASQPSTSSVTLTVVLPMPVTITPPSQAIPVTTRISAPSHSHVTPVPVMHSGQSTIPRPAQPVLKQQQSVVLPTSTAPSDPTTPLFVRSLASRPTPVTVSIQRPVVPAFGQSGDSALVRAAATAHRHTVSLVPQPVTQPVTRATPPSAHTSTSSTSSTSFNPHNAPRS